MHQVTVCTKFARIGTVNYNESRRVLRRYYFFQLKMYVKSHHLLCVGLRQRLVKAWDAQLLS